jgi:hypothetical protein
LLGIQREQVAAINARERADAAQRIIDPDVQICAVEVTEGAQHLRDQLEQPQRFIEIIVLRHQRPRRPEPYPEPKG